MKRVVIGLVLGGMVLGALALTLLAAEAAKPMAMPMGGKVTVSGAAKGEQVTVTGQLSCTFCTLAHPDKPCPPGCCATCVKAGDPVSLTDAEGNLYILLTSEQGVALMTPERTAMLGSKVVVKGLLVKAKGIQAVYVDSIAKAPEAKAP
jgi:hypothetical protein